MLHDKVAIITGGTGALGKGVLSVFLELGAKVLTTYRSDKELDECVDLKERHGDSIMFCKADVTSAAQISHLVTETKDTSWLT